MKRIWLMLLALGCERDLELPEDGAVDVPVAVDGYDRALEIEKQIDATIDVSPHCSKERSAVEAFDLIGETKGWGKVDKLERMRAVFFLEACKGTVYRALIRQEIETAVDNGWTCRDIALTEGRFFQRICLPEVVR